MSEVNHLPNFLIVGAAKSGTTSLHYYLDEHPDIQMSNPKEPKFFSYHSGVKQYNGIGDEKVKSKIVKNLKDYKSMFDSDNVKMRGESSADNLYFSDSVIPLIKEIIGEDTKIIIILRNPVERAFSAYSHLKRDNRETLTFKEALNEEETRLGNGWEFIWHYKNVGKYYEQVKVYKQNFKFVKVYFYEDLMMDSKSFIKDVYSFLGVDSKFVPKNIYDKFNMSGAPKNIILHNFLKNKSFLKEILKFIIPFFIRTRLVNIVKEKNLEKNVINPKDKEYLINYYSQNIQELEKLLDCDLSHWYNL